MSNVTHQSNAASAPAFAHLKFPTYEFREYPKMVKDAAGKDVVVNDAREELALLKTAQAEDEGGTEGGEQPGGTGDDEQQLETVEVEVPRGRRGRRQG